MRLTFCRRSSSSTTMHGTCQVRQRSINDDVCGPEWGTMCPENGG